MEKQNNTGAKLERPESDIEKTNASPGDEKPNPDIEKIPKNTKPERLKCLDALRGFDMFWIIGGTELILAILLYAGCDELFIKKIKEQFRHCGWEGFHFYDVIFPLFIFMSGITIPYSIFTRRSNGTGAKELQLKIIKRFCLLALIGLSFTLFTFDMNKIKIYNVLFLIAGSYLVGASICLHRPKLRSLLAWSFGILIAYHMIILYMPFPGKQGQDLLPGRTLACYIDQNLLQFTLHMGLFSAEGIIRIFPGGALCILGCITGMRIKSYPQARWRCALELCIGGLLLLFVGNLWGKSLPLIKALWTSSYVIYSCGWSLLLLSLFYVLVDLLKIKPISYLLAPIGMNAITIYAASHYFNFLPSSQFFFKGLAMQYSKNTQIVILAFGFFFIQWVLLKWLQSNKIFLRV